MGLSTAHRRVHVLNKGSLAGVMGTCWIIGRCIGVHGVGFGVHVPKS